MIHIANKANCCGCSACVQRCPQHCITLHEDTEGFLYPEVNMEACVDCGLCEKVCPWTGRSDALQPLQTLAVRNPKEEERLASSSGGVFVALAHSVIEKGGVVFGAAFSEKSSSIIDAKFSDSPLSILVLAIFCGILMFTAVEGFARSKSSGNYPASLFLVIIPI